MNYIYISPERPANFYQFSVALKEHGVNVLGIGDCPYENLDHRLQESLAEYYYIEDVRDYQLLSEAVASFKEKYGDIDWIGSDLEDELIKQAKLRDDFDVKNGLKSADAEFLSSQVAMKELYKLADLKVTRYHVIDDYENTHKFIKMVGYPVVIKPDNRQSKLGITKIESNEELKAYFEHLPEETMIVEEYLDGDLISYDGIVNRKQEIILDTIHVYPRKPLDIEDKQMDFFYWSIKKIPEAFKEASRSILEVFKISACCFRFEFLILQEDKVGLGERGDIIGVAVHLCAFTGFSTDMIRCASDNDFYDIYANMIVNDQPSSPIKPTNYYAVYASRKDQNDYLIPFGDIERLFKVSIMLKGYNNANNKTLGDRYMVARFKNADDIWTFINAVVETNK